MKTVYQAWLKRGGHWEMLGFFPDKSAAWDCLREFIPDPEWDLPFQWKITKVEEENL
jgi:hypothetical protein